MYTYQIIILIISIIAIVLATHQYRKDSLNVMTLISWVLIWILIIIFSLFPQISTIFASIFGLGRGLDALYIFAVIISFYIMFKLYNKIDEQKKRIDNLVSQLAIYENEQDDKF